MSQFRWADILEALDKPTGEDAAPEIDAPYLGASLEDGVLCHRWLDGTVLPVLSGGAGDDDDDSDDSDDEGSDDDDDDEGDGNEGDDDESTLTHKQMANLRRSSRQAARFRIAAKNERAAHVETTTERDDLKRELAFTRAAGHRFADLDAAWKLVDKKLIKIDDDGEVNGANDAIDALIDSHPFIATTDADEKHAKDDNPFRPTTSGSPMTGKKRPVAATTSEATLAKRYPALRR